MVDITTALPVLNFSPRSVFDISALSPIGNIILPTPKSSYLCVLTQKSA